MEKYRSKYDEDFEEWESSYISGDCQCADEDVSKIEFAWNHQQAKIDNLEQEKKELVEALEQSVECLKQGKSKFAPHTTNSFVDEFIEKWEAKIKSEGKNEKQV